MKNQAEYRLPKKMKKRRQLDALVDTVKLPRSRKNSGSAQDLLDCQSDSSENDFSPPASASEMKTHCCLCNTVVAQISLFMVTMACLATCVALIWVQWHIKHELDSLRQQVNSVQNSDKVPPVVFKLQSQIAEVNSSLLSVKTGKGSIEDITSSISDIWKKLQELQDAHKTLQASVSSSSELLDLPKRVTVLFQTVAKLGSDVKQFDEVQTSHYDELKKKITLYETSTEENMGQASTSDEPPWQKLMNFTGSVKTGFKVVGQELERQSTRINLLEDFTKSHPEGSKPSFDNSEIAELVTKLLEDKMANVSGVSPSAQNSTGSSQVPVSPVEKGEFLAFKADILGNFQDLNETFIYLNKELSTLATHLESHDRAILNLTVAITSLKNGSSAPEPSSTPAASTSASGSVSIPPGELTTTTDKAKMKFQIPGIKTWEDLDKAFKNDWNLKDDMLDLSALNKLQNMTITEEEFQHFDQNGDHLYNEIELADALGLEPNPRR